MEGKRSCGAEAPGESNWRKEADHNLKRLHSLLFAADGALDRGDNSCALTLGISLLGFLESRTETADDAAYIAPIRAEICSKIDTASRSLAAESDR